MGAGVPSHQASSNLDEVPGEHPLARTNRICKWIVDGAGGGDAGDASGKKQRMADKLAAALSVWWAPLSSSDSLCEDNGKVPLHIGKMALAVGLPLFARVVASKLGNTTVAVDYYSRRSNAADTLLLRTLPRVIENGSVEEIGEMLEIVRHLAVDDKRAKDAALLSAATRGDISVFDAVCAYVGQGFGKAVAGERLADMVRLAQHSDEARWTVLEPAADLIRMLMRD